MEEGALFFEKTKESLSSIGISSPQVDEMLRASVTEVMRECNLRKMERWLETYELAIIKASEALDVAELRLKYGVARLLGCHIEHCWSGAAAKNKTQEQSLLVVNVLYTPGFYSHLFRLSEQFHWDNFVYREKRRYHYHASLIDTKRAKHSKIRYFVEKIAPDLMREIGDIDFFWGESPLGLPE